MRVGPRDPTANLEVLRRMAWLALLIQPSGSNKVYPSEQRDIYKTRLCDQYSTDILNLDCH